MGGGTKPGWGKGDKNHVHTGPPGHSRRKCQGKGNRGGNEHQHGWGRGDEGGRGNDDHQGNEERHGNSNGNGGGNHGWGNRGGGDRQGGGHGNRH